MPRFTLLPTKHDVLEEQITEDIHFTEQLAGPSFNGVRGVYSASHWPSDVEAYRHPEQPLWRLSASWELPYGVRGNYLSLEALHKEVSSKLSPAALRDHKFVDANTDEELFPNGAVQKSVQSLTAGTVNNYRSGVFEIREHWQSHTVTIEISGDVIRSTVHVTKDRGASLYQVSAAFDLPDSLRGQFSDVEQVLSLLTKAYCK